MTFWGKIGLLAATVIMVAMAVYGGDDGPDTRRIHTSERTYATKIDAVSGCSSELVKPNVRSGGWVCADSDYDWYWSQGDANAACGARVVDTVRIPRLPKQNTWRIMYGCPV